MEERTTATTLDTLELTARILKVMQVTAIAFSLVQISLVLAMH